MADKKPHPQTGRVACWLYFQWILSTNKIQGHYIYNPAFFLIPRLQSNQYLHRFPFIVCLIGGF